MGKKQARLILSSMIFNIDEYGFVYYHEFLFAILRKRYLSSIIGTKEDKYDTKIIY